MKHWITDIVGEDRPALLSLMGLALLLLVVPIYLGGGSFEAQSFLFVLSAPIAYFAWRSNREAFIRTITGPTSMLFGALLAFMALSLVPSADKFTSFINLLHWMSYYFVFMAAAVLLTSSKRVSVISGAAVISATILSLYGLYGVLVTTQFSYLRLTSTFAEHNAFGGFLLLPIALIGGMFLDATTRRARLISGGLLALLTSALILTFSRGSWLGLVVGVAVAAWVVKPRLRGFLSDTKGLLRIGAVILVTLAVTLSALQIANTHAGAANQSVGVFTGETLGENALTARLHYFKDALTVIAHNPLWGVGLHHYGEAVKLYKDTPAFYASSPHNEYLQLFAEIGLLGGLVFIALLVLIVLQALRFVRMPEAPGWSRAALFAGIVAALLNLGMEVVWGYAANPLFFFIIAGAVYGMGPLSNRTAMVEGSTGTRLSLNVLLVVGVLVSIVGVGYWYQSYHLQRGLSLVTHKQYAQALVEFKEANRFGDFDFSPHYFSGYILENASHLTGDTTLQKKFLTQSLAEMQLATARKPEKPLFYSWQALIYKELGDEDGYRTALEKTIQYNPVEGIYEYDQLASLYNYEKKYDEVITLANTVLPYYPLSLYANPYWVNPDKATVWSQVADVYQQLSIAYTKKGDSVKAKEAADTAKLYVVAK